MSKILCLKGSMYTSMLKTDDFVSYFFVFNSVNGSDFTDKFFQSFHTKKHGGMFNLTDFFIKILVNFLIGIGQEVDHTGRIVLQDGIQMPVIETGLFQSGFKHLQSIV